MIETAKINALQQPFRSGQMRVWCDWPTYDIVLRPITYFQRSTGDLDDWNIIQIVDYLTFIVSTGRLSWCYPYVTFNSITGLCSVPRVDLWLLHFYYFFTKWKKKKKKKKEKKGKRNLTGDRGSLIGSSKYGPCLLDMEKILYLLFIIIYRSISNIAGISFYHSNIIDSLTTPLTLYQHFFTKKWNIEIFYYI